MVSITHTDAGAAQADMTADVLQNTFNISLWLMVVPLFTGFLIYRRMPAFITLLLSSLAACIAAFVAQPHLIAEIAGSAGSAPDLQTGLRGIMITWFGSTSIQTGEEAINALISTRGINGMMPTILLVICAATFGGVLRGSGMIQSITEALTKGIRSRTGMVASTVATGAISNLTTGDQYLSIFYIKS